MDRISLFFIIIMCISLPCSANVDVCAKNDTLYVAFVTGYNQSYIFRPAVEDPVFLGEFSHVSIGTYEDYLVFAGSDMGCISNDDSIFVLSPDDYSVITYRSVEGTDIASAYEPGDFVVSEISVPRYSDEVSGMIPVVRAETWFTGPVNDIWLASVAVDMNDTQLSFLDTLGHCYGTGGAEAILLGPVRTAESTTFQFSSGVIYGSIPYPRPSWVIATTHQQYGEPLSGYPDSMMLNIIYFYEGMDDFPEVLVLGSCYGVCTGFWKDHDQQINFSVFDNGNPYIVFSQPYQYADDINNNPLAMSCNPEDQGILLVWQKNGFIRVRYWENVWNPDSHVITECSPVYYNNLSVCSVSDGYWIACLPDGSSQPSVYFIERSTVTGVSTETTAPLSELNLTVFPTPFTSTSNIRFLLTENTMVKLRVYNLSGRIVDELCEGIMEKGEHQINWTPESALPAGCYFVILESEGQRVSRRCVKL